MSAALAGIGVAAGDRVAILSGNNPEWVFTFWGTVDLGAVLVGLNAWWKADEIVYGLVDSGSKVLIADRERFARITAARGGPALQAVYLIDGDPAVGGRRCRRLGGSGSVPMRSFESLAASPTAVMPDAPIAETTPP